MNELDRKKSYVYAIENYAGIPPVSNVKLAHIIYLVSLSIGDAKCPSVGSVRCWYKQYQYDRRSVISHNQGGLSCKH